jgi:hypothetical protein
MSHKLALVSTTIAASSTCNLVISGFVYFFTMRAREVVSGCCWYKSWLGTTHLTGTALLTNPPCATQRAVKEDRYLIAHSLRASSSPGGGTGDMRLTRLDGITNGSIKVILFFPSAVPATRKAGYTRSRTSVRNRLSGKLSPNLSGAPDRFHDMTILNRGGLQACRVG